jgi:hypothetical protein
VSGGTPELRQRVVSELERGMARGHLFDAATRLMLETVDADARSAHPVTAELGLAEALERLRAHDILQPVPQTVEEAVEALRGGFMMNVTRWGGCLLRAEDGPCPAGGEDCAIGVTPRDPRVLDGCGCRYQVLTPLAEEHVDHEIALMEAQLKAMVGPQWAQWRSTTEAKLRIHQLQRNRVRALAAGDGAAGGCVGGCAGQCATAVEGLA